MTDAVFNQMLEELDVEWYLDFEGIDYKPTVGARGPQLNVRECPVCGNSSFKVYLNAENGLGNCFAGSCEATFNKYSFIKAHLNDAAFPLIRDHVALAAKEQGWRPKKLKGRPTSDESKTVTLPASIALPHEGRNLTYLVDRGIDGEYVKYFHLRYCDQGMFFATNREGKPFWQDFSKRVIIPVYDLDGELVTFQGRDVTGRADPKYKFPSGLPGTARFLYNGLNAIGAKHIVMNEGVFDVIATKMSLDLEPGLRDVAVIGTFGKHLSGGHVDGNDQVTRLVQLKKSGAETVTIMWDGEHRAYEDAISAALAISSLGMTARVATLPAGKDPNEAMGSICDAYLKAVEVNRRIATKLRMTNPYPK